MLAELGLRLSCCLTRYGDQNATFARVALDTRTVVVLQTMLEKERKQHVQRIPPTRIVHSIYQLTTLGFIPPSSYHSHASIRHISIILLYTALHSTAQLPM